MARDHFVNSAGQERFPEPKLGNGPGEFASETELDAAKRALMWSRQSGQVGNSGGDERLMFEATARAECYGNDMGGNWGTGGM